MRFREKLHILVHFSLDRVNLSMGSMAAPCRGRNIQGGEVRGLCVRVDRGESERSGLHGWRRGSRCGLWRYTSVLFVRKPWLRFRRDRRWLPSSLTACVCSHFEHVYIKPTSTQKRHRHEIFHIPPSRYG